jgi:hypothetical protein
MKRFVFPFSIGGQHLDVRCVCVCVGGGGARAGGSSALVPYATAIFTRRNK